MSRRTLQVSREQWRVKTLVYLIVLAVFCGVPIYVGWKYLIPDERKERVGWTIFFGLFALLAIGYVIVGLLAEALKPFGV